MVLKNYADWETKYQPDQGDFLVLLIPVQDVHCEIFEEEYVDKIGTSRGDQSMEEVVKALKRISLELTYMEASMRYVTNLYPAATFELSEVGITVNELTDKEIIDCATSNKMSFVIQVIR